MSGRVPRILLLAVLGCPAAAQPWIDFLRTPILTDDDRQSMMFSYVDQHLPPIAIPETEQAEARAARHGILKAGRSRRSGKTRTGAVDFQRQDRTGHVSYREDSHRNLPGNDGPGPGIRPQETEREPRRR